MVIDVGAAAWYWWHKCYLTCAKYNLPKGGASMRSIGRSIRLTIPMLFCCQIVALGNGQTAQKDGFLSVTVSLQDTHVPLTSAFVFVRGYRQVYLGESSSVLRQVKDGVFATSLPPGIYDVFVSDVGTIPICKRVVIVTGEGEHYDANLKVDFAHLEK